MSTTLYSTHFYCVLFSNVNNQRLVCSSKKRFHIESKIIFRDYHGWTKALKIKFHAYFLRNKDEIENGMWCWMKWIFEFSNWFLGRFLYRKQCAPIKIFKQKSFLCIQKNVIDERGECHIDRFRLRLINSFQIVQNLE